MLQSEIVSRLTNKVILLLDQDEPGRAGCKKSEALLRSKGVKCVILDHPEGVKDSGTIGDYAYLRRVADYKELISSYSLLIGGTVACF